MVDDNLMRFFQSDGGGDKIHKNKMQNTKKQYEKYKNKKVQKAKCKNIKYGKLFLDDLMTIFQPNGGGDTHGTAGHRGCCESRSYMDFRW